MPHFVIKSNIKFVFSKFASQNISKVLGKTRNDLKQVVTCQSRSERARTTRNNLKRRRKNFQQGRQSKVFFFVDLHLRNLSNAGISITI